MKFRIVGLGDSTTAGTPGFQSPLEAPPDGSGNPESQYSYWIMKTHPDWIVLNRGINGQRTDEILARFQRDVTRASPEYVIILAGVNDIYQNAPLQPMQDNLLIMYENAISAGIKPVAASVLPFISSDSQAKAIVDLNAWIEATAHRLKILFCDTNRAVADPERPNRLRSSPDGNHPDVSGYRSMGYAIGRTIAAHIQSKRNETKPTQLG
jgi:lysophospholipase L1-like esterase